MGRVGACSPAVLDGCVPGAHRAGAYHHPHHDWAVLCAPGGHTRGPTGQGPTGVGDLYPAFWQCAQSDGPFIIPLLFKWLKLFKERTLATQRYPLKGQSPRLLEMSEYRSYRLRIQIGLLNFKGRVRSDLVARHYLLFDQFHECGITHPGILDRLSQGQDVGITMRLVNC